MPQSKARILPQPADVNLTHGLHTCQVQVMLSAGETKPTSFCDNGKCQSSGTGPFPFRSGPQQTDKPAPCVHLGEQNGTECCFPAGQEITAQAPVVRKGPGICTKRQKLSLVQPSHAAQLHRSNSNNTDCTPLSLSSYNSTLDLLEAVLCISWWVHEDKDPEGFPD